MFNLIRISNLSLRKVSITSPFRPRSISATPIRSASQLYPTTSQKWDDAMVKAESIAGDASNFSNLQNLVGREFTSITKYLQRLIGTNHPMLETAKRCSYISEGKMGSAQARGLIVLLTAKAIDSIVAESVLKPESREQTIRRQISLAEMTEMTYSAYMIHRGVMDLKMHGLEEVSIKYDESLKRSVESVRGLHYGNKVSVLCGDFLLAYVMRGLGDLFNSKAVDLVASAITDFINGEFLLLDDWTSKNYLLTENSRDLDRWERRSYATLGSLQGNTCQATLVVANVRGDLEEHAREFGKNIGLAWQAHTELQPFLNDTYEPIELPDMPPYPAYDLNCLPVMLFLRNAYHTRANFRLLLDDIKGFCIDDISRKSHKLDFDIANQHRHQEAVDYKKLHEIILDNGHAVAETFKMINGYAIKAQEHLRPFPPSQAKDVLNNICESLYRK